MPGSPDVSAFPRTAWLASTRRALTDTPTEALRAGDPRGRPELREALAEYLGRARGVRASADSIVVCAGTRHAVELLARVFGKRGPIAVEAYGLFVFRDAIAALGIPTTPIGIDEHGARVDELDRTGAAAALLTPAHFFPHGVPLHPAGGAAVIDWARRTRGYVLEDDYDGEFRYDRQPVGAVQGLDPQRVAYLGSASKSLSPVLRLGWMALPDDLVEPVLAAAGGQQFYVNAIDQLTMADFIATGQYDKHIRRMRNTYRKRRDEVVRRLSTFDVRITGMSAGLHLLLSTARRHRARGAASGGRGRHLAVRIVRLRHPLAGDDVRADDGLVVNFGAPADHCLHRGDRRAVRRARGQRARTRVNVAWLSFRGGRAPDEPAAESGDPALAIRGDGRVLGRRGLRPLHPAQRHFGLQLDLAKTAGWIAGTTTAYLLNRRWTFQAPPSKSRLAAVWALYITTFVVQVGINHVLVAALEDSWWRKPLAFVIAQGTATVINFVIQRAVIFKLRTGGSHETEGVMGAVAGERFAAGGGCSLVDCYA